MSLGEHIGELVPTDACVAHEAPRNAAMVLIEHARVCIDMYKKHTNIVVGYFCMHQLKRTQSRQIFSALTSCRNKCGAYYENHK